MASPTGGGSDEGVGLAAGKGAARRIELAAEAPIAVGPVTVEPGRRLIGHADGREAVLEPRAMKVLIALLRARGAVLSRDTLFDLCWEGRAVSDDAVDRAVARLRRAIAPVVDGIVEIETVTKVGHRAVLRLALPEKAAAASDEGRGAKGSLLRPLLLGLVALIVAAGAFWWLSRPTPQSNGLQSVGIVPFRGSAGADAHLAGGLSDQVRADLARRSDLRIVTVDPPGAAVLDDSVALRLGRRIGVRYVVLGHLHREGGRARVQARLLDTAESRRIWSDTLSAPLSEMSLLQERIGARIASALGLRLMPVQGPRTAASGEAQALYLTARGLIRSRDGRNMATAATLLREAISRDPEFAPAWAKLGAAIALGSSASPADDPAQDQAALAQAISFVRRALALDPQLAEAHGILGMLLSFNSEEAASHIRRAAELDPNDAEIQLWRGHIYGSDLDPENQLAAYRRAAALDPLWWPPAFETMRVASGLGRNSEAETEARRFGNLSSAGIQRLLVANLAELRGEYARAARGYDAVRRSSGPEREFAGYALHNLLQRIGLGDLAARIPGLQAFGSGDPYGESPSIEAVRAGSGGRSAAFEELNHRVRAVKRLVSGGRAATLAELYHSPTGLLTLSSRGRALPANLLEYGAIVALVLRQAGQEDEARRLLAAAQAQVERAVAPPAPASALALAAEVWAVAGHDERAIDSLERAVAADWRYAGTDRLRDIADEPAFARLRNHPRFIRLRQRITAHLDRERAEIRRALIPA